jgi:hypothetical protein
MSLKIFLSMIAIGNQIQKRHCHFILKSLSQTAFNIINENGLTNSDLGMSNFPEACCEMSFSQVEAANMKDVRSEESSFREGGFVL